MERIRMGLIGCGEIAQIMHLPFLTELRDLFEVRALCDISPQLVETVGDLFHVPHRTTDYLDLLARDDIDAVAILTADHAPVALAAARADSFHPPHQLCVEIQSFLAEHEQLFSPRTYAETAVVFSVESDFQRVARRDLFADNRLNASRGGVVPFWQVCEALSDSAQPYDVVFFPDGQLRADVIAAGDLRQYRSVILPDCAVLTVAQAQALRGYLDMGGRLLVLGELGANLPSELRQALLAHQGTTQIPLEQGFRPENLPGGPQVRVAGAPNIALNIQRVGAGAAVHIIRYDYDDALDRVPPLASLALELRLPERFTGVVAHSAQGVVEASLAAEGDIYRIELRDVPLYTIVCLSEE